VAIEETNLPAIELLIQRGASLDQRDAEGMTALALAAEMGFQEAVEMLLAAGADPNVLDNAGTTALDVAEEHGAHDISTVLLRYGAKPAKEFSTPDP
jgi:ankyrin repeat protein